MRIRTIRRRRGLHVPKLTDKERGQLSIINAALDALTEFGLETASHGRLLQVCGEATMALRLLKARL